MAFKTLEQFNDSRYHGMFRLINDGDSADVIFMYKSIKDALQANAHYIKSSDYSGYIHCCGQGCPACNKGIRVQSKLFIPLYNIEKETIEFWDRTPTFEPQLTKDVFSRFPDPSGFVFGITRHGVPNDINTRYSIEPVAKNTIGSYETILAKFNAKMPDYYSTIIKEYSIAELDKLLQNPSSPSISSMPEYTPIPRSGYQTAMPETISATPAPTLPDVEVTNTNFTSSSDAVAAAEDYINDDDEELPDPVF